MKKLQEELARLKKAEPTIEAHLDSGSNFIAERLVFSPLEEVEIATLMKKIMSHFPMATSIAPEKRAIHELDMSSIRRLSGEVFVSATEADLAKYKDKLYPQWLNDCESFLGNLHQKLNTAQEPLKTTVRLTNTGSRPADNALITFSANGTFLIHPPFKKDEEDEEVEQNIRLPRPPAAPHGYWKKSSFHAMAESFASVRPIDLAPLLNPQARKTDPNRFYYQDKPKFPVNSFSLDCQQWRHQDGDEGFDIVLNVAPTPSCIADALEVKAQAANMADPLVMTFPIRITLKEASTLEKAEELIEWLVIEGPL
ncbi:hypothetical protein PWG14_27440 [Chromobacterium amazonense]|uniref:hypothetical protein n=1 Tax=Chromobacterium amazonense TaxID=1382803 RepID=UPI00237E3DF6|nr:hypothetical protein [Chromobacterium amazonense]MDE1716203.1 hypothetical protein [Chromobacterium amazonense]